ncbi:uncharacterized protein METZ01_LOCUS415318, partial [marine metagenome]
TQRPGMCQAQATHWRRRPWPRWSRTIVFEPLLVGGCLLESFWPNLIDSKRRYHGPVWSTLWS